MSQPIVDINSTDSYDPATIECPWQYDAALREQGDVYYDEKNDMYLVTSYERINEVLHDPETFSSRFYEKILSKDPFPEEILAIMAKGYPLKEALLISDGDIHDRHRKIATTAFSRKRLKELAPFFAEKASELIDRVIDSGKMEFHRDIADPLPLNTLQQQLRVADEDMERCREWSHVLEAGFAGIDKPLETMRWEAEKNVECQLYFVGRIEEEMERIRTTGSGHRDDDTYTLLAKAILDPDDPMDMGEAISFIINLFPANNGTTTVLLLACMHRFTAHPEIQARIAENPKVISKLIEETARHESVSRITWRRATKDTRVGGVDIPEGKWLLLRTSSAHRDACAYANPEVFDIDRKGEKPHLSFGSGIHMCAGRFFARHIVTEVLSQLSQRASDFAFIEGANSFEHTTNIIIPAYKELHIKFTPKH